MRTLTLAPYRRMTPLREAMDRLFDDAFFAPIHSNGGHGLTIDVEADNDGYTVRANVPGLKAEDLNIEVLDNTVTISGEIKSEGQTEDSSYLLQERRYGRFSRSFTLPVPIDSQSVKADLENGVLTLSLPKAEAARPKVISVKSK